MKNPLSLSIAILVMLCGLVVEPCAAGPSLSLNGLFEVNWTIETTRSNSFSESADDISAIHFFDNYVLLQSASGNGLVLTTKRLIDFSWIALEPAELTWGESQPDQATPVPQPTSTAQAVEQLEEIPASYLKYAEGLVEKYDVDGNGYLTNVEWAEVSGDPSAADTNGDGQITVDEYARFVMKR